MQVSQGPRTAEAAAARAVVVEAVQRKANEKAVAEAAAAAAAAAKAETEAELRRKELAQFSRTKRTDRVKKVTGHARTLSAAPAAYAASGTAPPPREGSVRRSSGGQGLVAYEALRSREQVAARLRAEQEAAARERGASWMRAEGSRLAAAAHEAEQARARAAAAEESAIAQGEARRAAALQAAGIHEERQASGRGGRSRAACGRTSLPLVAPLAFFILHAVGWVRLPYAQPLAPSVLQAVRTSSYKGIFNANGNESETRFHAPLADTAPSVKPLVTCEPRSQRPRRS